MVILFLFIDTTLFHTWTLLHMVRTHLSAFIGEAQVLFGKFFSIFLQAQILSRDSTRIILGKPVQHSFEFDPAIADGLANLCGPEKPFFTVVPQRSARIINIYLTQSEVADCLVFGEHLGARREAPVTVGQDGRGNEKRATTRAA